MDHENRISLPRWVAVTYAIMAIILIPWIFDLAYNLPTRHIVHHWDAVWVGFDILLVIVLLTTVYFVISNKIWVIISASALATLFIVDAWFDILTSRSGPDLHRALFFGILEIVFAILTFRFVFHVTRQLMTSGRISYSTYTRKQHRLNPHHEDRNDQTGR